MKYMPERRLFCELGRRMWEKGWVAANDGNLSMRVESGQLLVTPAGVSKGFMTPDMILLLDTSGEPLDLGSPWVPSSELLLHLRCYKLRGEINGVCHAHPPYATAFACARLPIDVPILGETLMSLGPVPCAPYARTGTQALALVAAPLLAKYNGVLLANHGAVTLGSGLEAAYLRMETLEHTARIHLNTRLLGGGISLTSEEAAELR